MAIKIVDKYKYEDVEDKNGNVIGQIRYNPEDTKTYQSLLNVINTIKKIVDKKTNVNKIKKLPEDKKIESIEEFEEFGEVFNGMSEYIDFVIAETQNIKKEIDNIFGKGTSILFMQDSEDVELLVPLLDAIIPEFENAREKKTNKYLSGVNDVMR